MHKNKKYEIYTGHVKNEKDVAIAKEQMMAELRDRTCIKVTESKNGHVLYERSGVIKDVRVEDNGSIVVESEDNCITLFTDRFFESAVTRINADTGILSVSGYMRETRQKVVFFDRIERKLRDDVRK